MVVIPSQTLLDILTELIDTGNLLETVALRLFSSNSTPNAQTVWADLTQSAFSGYAAAAAIAWTVPFIDLAGNAVVLTACHQFIQTAVTVSETAYGWALTTGTSPIVLRAAERFATPISFTVVGRAVTVSGRFPLDVGQA